MSTVRFSKVLEACGKPDIHLLLIDPNKDKTLQAAIKSDRVMTLYQQSGGTDHGVVGFEQGRSRQFLVFPKPLKPFLGQRIVGIKYELLEEAPVSKKEPAKKETVKQPDEQPSEPAPATKDHRPPKRAERQLPAIVSKTDTAKPAETTESEEEKVDQENGKVVSEDKVVKFQTPEPEERPATEREEIKVIKTRVREAMDALEQGKQVVAFNLLKRILEEEPNH
ncbi:MAG: hypothetical protein JO170_23715 [Verrucomicrobia bacterium]|nr:hypothetical protein [Verrucomicrobiota bacterium]